MAGKRALIKRAKKDLDDLKLTLRRGRNKAGEEALGKGRELGDSLKWAMQNGDPELIGQAVEALEDHLAGPLSPHRPNPTWETFKALFLALAIALFIRWGFVEPYRIPSGSMIPTLLIGDQLLVNKMSFGPDLFIPYIDVDFPGRGVDHYEKGAPLYTIRLGGHKLVIASRKLWIRRLPQRGEVVVFRYPDHPRDDYIKRVVGLPGDTVELRDGSLYINGELQPERSIEDYEGPVSRSGCSGFSLFEEDLDREGEPYPHLVIRCDSPGYSFSRNMQPRTVPEGMLFMMGDNRDQSSDSRSWGFAPVSFLKGSAMVIHLPLDPDRHYLPRINRFFKTIQ